jgi:hypothetical protein
VPHDHFHDRRGNRYRIVAKGSRIRTWLNERPVGDLIDDEAYRTHPKGFTGLQLHAIGPGTGPYGLRMRELSPFNDSLAGGGRRERTGMRFPPPVWHPSSCLIRQLSNTR